MEFIYTPNQDNTIIAHEEKMLKKYSEIIDGYRNVFCESDCSLEVGCRWINCIENKYSAVRLPFTNGYQCYIYCEVQRNGKEVHVKSFDGEVDFYPLSSSWIVSLINMHFCKLNVSLCSITDDVESNMNELYKLLCAQ
ncbi:MAG TPA: hypothetical protein IAA41_06605 [Candidatus Eubacterium faecavium]|nr:hypothetical protein [Candidatus Eubacterium faecavium]